MKPRPANPDAHPVRILDGSCPLLLYEAGFDPARPLAEAVLSCPQLVSAAHARFVQAGAQIVTTLTAAAHPLALARGPLADRIEEINRSAVRLARAEAGTRSGSAPPLAAPPVMGRIARPEGRGSGGRGEADSAPPQGATAVFGGLGPSGLFLDLDEVSLDDLRDAYRRQASWLMDAGADGIVLEGMSDLSETIAAIEAVRAIRAIPLAACMTFQTRGDSFATACGVTPEQAAAALEQAGADWIGCHGGLPLSESLPLVKPLAAATGKPLWVRLDVAEPEYEEKRLVYRQSPEEFAGIVPEFAGLRVGVVGGGQGATPEYVAALRAVVQGGRGRWPGHTG